MPYMQTAYEKRNYILLKVSFYQKFQMFFIIDLIS